MIIKAIIIEASVCTKIYEKHNVLPGELLQVLREDEPLLRKVAGAQYIAIGYSKSRFITIFFAYDNKEKQAVIATAYPSDKNQISFYKRSQR